MLIANYNMQYEPWTNNQGKKDWSSKLAIQEE